MTTSLWILFGGMALFGIAILLIDITSRRRERKEQSR